MTSRGAGRTGLQITRGNRSVRSLQVSNRLDVDIRKSAAKHMTVKALAGPPEGGKHPQLESSLRAGWPARVDASVQHTVPRPATYVGRLVSVTGYRGTDSAAVRSQSSRAQSPAACSALRPTGTVSSRTQPRAVSRTAATGRRKFTMAKSAERHGPNGNGP